MMFPNCEQAYIPELKLTKYLLSATHAVGKAKGKYFRSASYTEANTDQLAKVLLMIAESERVSQEVATHYGTRIFLKGTSLHLAEPLHGYALFG